MFILEKETMSKEIELPKICIACEIDSHKMCIKEPKCDCECQADMTLFEYQRLVSWMKDPCRKPAILAFTAGTLRQCARAFEEYLESMKK